MWLSGLRALVRFYLSSFPLRNGKGRLYEALNEKLLPSERFVTTDDTIWFSFEIGPVRPGPEENLFFRRL